jgi:hypothetical protein
MSANVYTIADLLIGKVYRSRSVESEIVRAERHPHAVWYEGCDSYLVELSNGQFRSLAVKVGE